MQLELERNNQYRLFNVAEPTRTFPLKHYSSSASQSDTTDARLPAFFGTAVGFALASLIRSARVLILLFAGTAITKGALATNAIGVKSLVIS